MLSQYEVTGILGRGGMGAVYKGVQRNLDRSVAIKVLPAGLDDRRGLGFAERFQQEARAMARLSHPNIVAVHEAGETTDGLLYFVMDYIEGADVGQLLASEGRLDPARAVPIIAAVCEALAFAHHGLVFGGRHLGADVAGHHLADLLDRVDHVAPGFRDQRRVRGDAVEQPGRRELADFVEIGRVDEEFHVVLGWHLSIARQPHAVRRSRALRPSGSPRGAVRRVARRTLPI